MNTYILYLFGIEWVCVGTPASVDELTTFWKPFTYIHPFNEMCKSQPQNIRINPYNEIESFESNFVFCFSVWCASNQNNQHEMIHFFLNETSKTM